MRPSLDTARAALKRYFGYADFRAGQVDVVASVLSGADTLGVLPTGGGKSLCYQVPALVLPGMTVVISPLISLMQDQVDRLVSCGIAATFLNSTLDPEDGRRRLRSVERGLVRLLYVAPERFENPDLLAALARAGVGLLAVDEAHCISEWGHEFRPSYRRIADGAARFQALQVVALTATATPRVRRDITAQLRMRAPRVVVGGFDRPNLSYFVRRCASDDAKRAALADILGAEPGVAVVYAATRADVMRVTRWLARLRIPSAAYHGGLPHATRLMAQDAFMRERVRVIAATNAFGMGIDKPNVRLVVHHTMSGTLEAYYQEAGRAGRDGLPGRCVLLHAPDDRHTHDFFIRCTFPESSVARRVLAALERLAVGGRVPAGSATVARKLGIPPTDVAAAMRWLEREGVLGRGRAGGDMHVRLLALPARIARDLDVGSPERRALRALWRLEGERLMDGITIAAQNAPPARVLRALRARQFLQFEARDDALCLASYAREPDFAKLERRRAAETAKLDRMVEYARTTRCRRETLLAYFGERVSSAPCRGCDNCLAGRPIHH
ncbi:MAG TPA: ATP-dependent DNA helicase RecQ [Gemmatimonadaceae bacterium]|nr:ATP-dependent DNA helicase RecQ [Gemmatimonadaceae bacterium]